MLIKLSSLCLVSYIYTEFVQSLLLFWKPEKYNTRIYSETGYTFTM